MRRGQPTTEWRSSACYASFRGSSGLALTLTPSVAQAQSYPIAEDVATLDGIIEAYYEVVSGPAGQPRQWERDRSLHDPEAQIIIIRDDQAGRPVAHIMTLAEFHAESGSLEEQGFFEQEIHRETQRHGAVAHVWSTYEWRLLEEGPAGGRGINSISLYHDGERWWITSWMFDGREDAPSVPPEYLPDSVRSGEHERAAPQSASRPLILQEGDGDHLVRPYPPGVAHP
jgi:hypothetical protein